MLSSQMTGYLLLPLSPGAPWGGPPADPFRLSFKSHPCCIHSRKPPLPPQGITVPGRPRQSRPDSAQRGSLLHPWQPARLTAVLGGVWDGQRDIKKDRWTQGWTGGHRDGRVGI